MLTVALLFHDSSYLWPHKDQQPLSVAIPTPPGFRRAATRYPRHTEWLRGLPTLPLGSPVRLFDRSLKHNQSAHIAILDMDVGLKNHQQCADAVMRLHAEFLFASHREASICFRATNGTPLLWMDWKAGKRPVVKGKQIAWYTTGKVDGTWHSFRQYLDFVFVYAGTYSLEKELVTVALTDPVEPGDVFIQGGFPGHAVMVVDVAENDLGQRIFLLIQSYMPAQDIHVLLQPGKQDPWYPTPVGLRLVTPEWTFSPARRMRFREEKGCR